MRIKKSFSFDETKDAEDIIKNGFTNSTIDYSKMYLIAKYIREKFNYGAIRLEKELIKFCKTQDKNFNPITETDTIKKWIKSALNYKLRKITDVSISQTEIEFLKTISNNKDRKLIFVILVFSKALKKGNVRRKKTNLKTSEYYYIHYNNFSDIIRLSKLNNLSETDLACVLNKYRDYFTFYNAERELIRLDFIDKQPTKQLTINLDDIMEYYSIFFEKYKPTAFCIKCNTEIKKNSNKQKYCKECAKIKSREQHKQMMQKIRAVTK